MRAMGVAVAMLPKGATPRVVVVEGSAGGTVTVVEVFEAAAPREETADMLAEIAEAVGSRASGLAVDAVVVRRADQSARPSNKEAPRVRLLVEGAVAAVLRAKVPRTVVRDGAHAGKLYGADKTGLDAAAEALVVAAGHHARYTEAAGAALAGLRL